MAHYYKYDFTSPGPTYAIVKEELKSYFDTGVVDDLMFPTYLTKCMQKLSRATLPILETPLFVEDFEARLPDNFHAAREVWLCTEIPLPTFKDPSSFYSQSGTCTIQIKPVVIGGNPCDGRCAPDTGCPDCGNTNDCGELEQAIYKTTNYTERCFKQAYILKPGNISARQNCSVDYNKNWASYGQTPGSDSIDSFDIRDNKLITNFRNGTIHLIFYGETLDADNRVMIPDNYRIKEYVEAFIKYKIFETISNQINDETFNQVAQKVQYYKGLSDEAFIMASIEVKKETIEEKARKIYKDKTRLRGYEKITSTNRGRYGRNRYNRNNF
jgi:hypothetical protein